MKRLLVAVFALLLCLPAQAQQQPLNLGTLNGSAVIATGNTFQSVLAAVTTVNKRKSLTIQNNNTTTDNCWVFVGPTASATKGTSLLLIPGASYTRYYPYIPSDNIAATCATSSNTLYLDTQ